MSKTVTKIGLALEDCKPQSMDWWLELAVMAEAEGLVNSARDFLGEALALEAEERDREDDREWLRLEV